jgi:gentisate 1,2-dioxygenase
MAQATNRNELLWAQLEALEKRNAVLAAKKASWAWEEIRQNCATMIAIFEELRRY